MRRTSSAALVLAVASVLPPPGAQAETIQITIQNLVFAPAEVQAKVGDTIEWTNKDVLAHTATARGGEFDVTIAANKNATLVLKQGGEVSYYCRYHPNMKGILK